MLDDNDNKDDAGFAHVERLAAHWAMLALPRMMAFMDPTTPAGYSTYLNASNRFPAAFGGVPAWMVNSRGSTYILFTLNFTEISVRWRHSKVTYNYSRRKFQNARKKKK